MISFVVLLAIAFLRSGLIGPVNSQGEIMGMPKDSFIRIGGYFGDYTQLKKEGRLREYQEFNTGRNGDGLGALLKEESGEYRWLSEHKGEAPNYKEIKAANEAYNSKRSNQQIFEYGINSIDYKNYLKKVKLHRKRLIEKQPKLICNATYLIHDGEREFELQSPNRSCQFNFLGSKVEQCRVALMCKGKQNLFYSWGDCSKDSDYLNVYDGTDGKEQLCGSTDIVKQISKIARNGGTDLFIEYQASSDSIFCTVSCLKDGGHTEVKELQKSDDIKRNPEKDCVCGIRDTNLGGRVVNGQEAQRFEFPWITPIAVKNTRDTFCGASLINDRYALTAAHCFDDGNFLIGQPVAEKIQLIFHSHEMLQFNGNIDPNIGNLNYNLERLQRERVAQMDHNETSTRVNIAQIISHPYYEPFRYDYDIAILKLEKPIDLTTGDILPICLPKVADMLRDFNNKSMTVAGWGLTVPDNEEGALTLQTLTMPTAECKLGLSSRRHFCAGFIEGGKGACVGDSGGPLITPSDDGVENQYFLAGIASAANIINCTAGGFPAMYTNVQEVIDWVYFHTRDGFFCKTDPNKKRPHHIRRNKSRGLGRLNKARGRNFNQVNLSSGEDLQRQAVSQGVFKFNGDLDEMDCNGNYSITEKRILTFTLDSPNKSCHYSFEGLLTENCRVAMTCNGQVNDKAKSTSCSNNADYFEVYDNYNGKEKLCGSSYFDNTTKMARNNGTHLFVVYKASSQNSICSVFCVNDVMDDNPVTNFMQLAEAKAY